MAKKEDSKKVLERVYNVPLRREFLKVPKWRRTEKAVKALKEFIAKHMKSEDVRLGRYANKLLWEKGIKNPPHHIKVNAVKDNEGIVRVELAELPPSAKREIEKQKALEKGKEGKEKKEEKAAKEEQKAKKPEEIKAEKIEERVEEAKKEKEEKAKEIEKEEIKELQKEHPKIHAPKQTMETKQAMKHPTAPKSV
ncbi:MAG: 50S ribosomal protein L31e [Nanoarchaeota archaeon]